VRQKLIDHLERKLGEYVRIGSELSFECPFCAEPSHTPKLGVNLDTGVWHCFKCDIAGGSPAWLLRETNGGKLDMDDVIALAGDDTMVGSSRKLTKQVIALFRGVAKDRKTVAGDLKPVPLPPETVSASDYARVRLYFTSRGYTKKQTEDLVGTYGIRYVPGIARRIPGEPDRRNHIIFPVNVGGRQVWYTTRSIRPDAVPKSLNPRNIDGHFHKEDVILGFDEAVGCRDIVVSEGPFSMAAFRTLGSRSIGPTALCGTTLSTAQVALYRLLADRGAERFVVATEGDKARFRNSLCAALAPIRPVYVLPLAKSDGDPDDNKHRLREMYDAAVPYSSSSAMEIYLQSALSKG